ncbi:hypothetical protein [Siphonobacter sp. SORGH_AS_0500]|uniref:hypothetical protein n=1 Tax=Siphonobacter sp. SORGH_AS_0500 TaxID=1864824 RepID=UPI0028642343|nr:hypothetical protein [Siphonobacter sp. SORGH_AS_0500]MDR6197205.1 hypothetical protein [Siphonobacter sp. SORGH_AS_0500]
MASLRFRLKSKNVVFSSISFGPFLSINPNQYKKYSNEIGIDLYISSLPISNFYTDKNPFRLVVIASVHDNRYDWSWELEIWVNDKETKPHLVKSNYTNNDGPNKDTYVAIL